MTVKVTVDKEHENRQKMMIMIMTKVVQDNTKTKYRICGHTRLKKMRSNYRLCAPFREKKIPKNKNKTKKTTHALS